MCVSCCFFHSRTLAGDTRLAGTGLLKIYRAALKPHVILASSNSDIVEHRLHFLSASELWIVNGCLINVGF